MPTQANSAAAFDPLAFLDDRADDNFTSGGSGRPFTFRMEDIGKRYHIGFLSPVFRKVRLHYEKNGAPIYCENLYYSKDELTAFKAANEGKTPCEHCNKPNATYPERKNTPQENYVAMGYVAEYAPVDGNPVKRQKKNGGGEFDESPEKLIVTSAGKGKANWKFLLEGMGDGDILEKFWRYEKDAAAGFMPPTAVEVKKLGNKFDMAAFLAAREKWMALSPQEMSSILLCGYQNIKWDHPAFVQAGLKNPYPDTPEAAPAAGGEEGDSDLSGADLD